MLKDGEAEAAFWKVVQDSDSFGLWPSLRTHAYTELNNFESVATALGYLARKNGFQSSVQMIREFSTSYV